MTQSSSLSRRQMMLGAAALTVLPACTRADSVGSSQAHPTGPTPTSLKGRLYKSLKFGMVREKLSLPDKFKLLKDIGFDGVEMDSPGVNVAEAVKASEQSGLPIDGTVCSTHWKVRLSDPDPATREKARRNYEQALRDTHAMGGHSCLLVVGHGRDGSFEQVWQRSIEQIRRALPLAAKLGVYIAIENVWNHFCYDHDGPDNQTAAQYLRYIDELNSPWVGMHLDLGNHQKYARPAEWIGQLGKRIVKLDVKDWAKNGGWKDIGEGDVDWPAVRKALLTLRYTGWAAAEVKGGDRNRLQQIHDQMDKVFGLG